MCNAGQVVGCQVAGSGDADVLESVGGVPRLELQAGADDLVHHADVDELHGLVPGGAEVAGVDIAVVAQAFAVAQPYQLACVTREADPAVDVGAQVGHLPVGVEPGHRDRAVLLHAPGRGRWRDR